jgi:hypothetical protein
LHFNEVNINHAKSGIDLSEGVFVFSLLNLTLNSICKLNISTTPNYFSGKGNVTALLKQLNVTFKLNFSLGENNFPNITVINSKVDISNNTCFIHFDGDGIFPMLNNFQEIIISAILNIISGELTNINRLKIQDGLNYVMDDTINPLPIEGTNVAIDYSLILNPRISKGILPISINGTSLCINKNSCKDYSEKRPSLPNKIDIFGGNGSLQIYISDYLFNSFFVAGYEDSIFNFTLTPNDFANFTKKTIVLDTDFIGIFIPDIKDRYGRHRPVTIQLNATNPPIINIHIIY